MSAEGPYEVRRYPVLAAQVKSQSQYFITRLSHPIKVPAALYKSNLQVEKLVKPQEETGKRDRIDKAKFTGKVTSTMQQREERARSHMGVEWKITEKREDGQVCTFYGHQVEAGKQSHALLFFRNNTFTAYPTAGWLDFQKDIEALRRTDNPLLRLTKEQHLAQLREKIPKPAIKQEDEEEVGRAVAKLERGLNPVKLFKPKALRGEGDEVIEAPKVSAEMASKISQKAKQNIQDRKKKREGEEADEPEVRRRKKKGAGVEQEEEEDDSSEDGDSDYDNYYGRLDRKKKQDREDMDYDENEEFEDDEEEDQLFMANDDEYEREIVPAVIKGGKPRPSFASKSRKIISKYEKEEDEEDEDEEEEGEESDLFSEEEPHSEEERSKMLGSRAAPMQQVSSYEPTVEKRTPPSAANTASAIATAAAATPATMANQRPRLTEHLLVEELRKEAKFELEEFCKRLERRYEIGEVSEFNHMVKRLAHIDEGRFLILKEQFRPTYSKSNLLFDK